MKETAEELLQRLNNVFNQKKEIFEKYYWIAYTKESSKENTALLNKYESEFEEFKSLPKNISDIDSVLETATDSEQKRLQAWKEFFQTIAIPENLISLRREISDLEGKIGEYFNNREEYYINLETGKKIPSSRVEMRTMKRTHSDESVRRAVHIALEELSLGAVDDYVKLVALRNRYAQELGYTDFYDYKVRFEDKMSKEELFGIFEEIYQGTKHGFDTIRLLEQDKPNLRKPWNYHFMMSGDVVEKEDQYFNIKNILEYWLRSMDAIGIDYLDSTIRMDLLARNGKYDNGFCHQPVIGKYNHHGKFIPGETNFTCNAVVGQVGSGKRALDTCFHEGGHAVHFNTMMNRDAFLNTEFMPMTAALSETQSMFLDAYTNTPEWKCTYAKNRDGKLYPFELYRESVEKSYVTDLVTMNSLMGVSYFEKEVYETEELTREKVIEISKRVHKKYYDFSEDSTYLLSIPHIYSFEPACQYHGYGLAMIALEQWRTYFYEKYGSIVDNKNIGQEMQKIWKRGSALSFPEMVQMAVGEKLSPKAYVNAVSFDLDEHFQIAEKRISQVLDKNQTGILSINANIELWHGDMLVADNSESLEKMILEYNCFLESLV